MQTKLLIATRPQRRICLNGGHVLSGIVVFFAAVFAVNATMIYAAVSTYSGVVASEPYRKGLHYNNRILANERQHLLHWLDTLSIDREGRVALSITNSDGLPIRGLNVETIVGRPSTNREDVRLTLIASAAGHYEARMPPLKPGSWIVVIEARSAAEVAEPIFRARKRIWMAP